MRPSRFPLFKFSAGALLLLLFAQSCTQADESVSGPGTEYLLEGEGLNDTAVSNVCIRVLEKRLSASLDNDEFDISLENGKIKVRIAEGAFEQEGMAEKIILQPGKLTFREVYFTYEVYTYFSIADSLYKKAMHIDLDTLTGLPAPGLNKFLIPMGFANQHDPYHPMVSVLLANCRVADTAEFNRIMRTDSIAAIFPEYVKLMWCTSESTSAGEDQVGLIACKEGRNYIFAPAQLLSVNCDVENDTTVIAIKTDVFEAVNWQKMTKENVGKPIAAEVDGFVYAYPNVAGEIKGGSTEIRGLEEDVMLPLCAVLSGGTLPTTLRIAQKKTF